MAAETVALFAGLGHYKVGLQPLETGAAVLRLQCTVLGRGFLLSKCFLFLVFVGVFPSCLSATGFLYLLFFL
jgi:hypothetical protein